MSLLPAVPVSGPGDARFQPIWTEDAADCVLHALDRDAEQQPRERFELVGPEVITYDGMVREVLRAHRRRRRLLHVPSPLVRAGLEALGAVAGNAAFATWEEAKLMDVSMTTDRGTADVESLGVTPAAMRAVLAAR
jgi:NADH dehydrogenase